MRFRHCILVAALMVAATAAPARAQIVATPYIDTNAAGDVQGGRAGLGASVAYYFRGLFGIELDVERHGHFFKDEDVADVVPDPTIDLNTDATIFMANAVVPFRIPGAAIWRPYAAAGLGAIHATFDSVSADQYDTQQTNLTFNVGGGIMHSLTHLVGVRVDMRYLHAMVDQDASEGGYFEDYGFWRVSVGVTFGFPE